MNRTKSDKKPRSAMRDEIALTDALIAETLAHLTDDMPWANQAKAFGRIRRLIEQRRKLVESEVRHIVLAREVMTTDEAMALVGAMVAIVTRYLPDPNDRAAIAEELHALISRPRPETPIGTHRYV